MELNEIGNEYLFKKTNKLFEEWGYTREITTYRCLFEDSLLVPFIKEDNGEYEFEISVKDLIFYQHLFDKGKIKTLLMFYQEDRVYYGFLQDLEFEKLIEVEEKTIYIDKRDLKMINFSKDEA